jgi:hypothetical protein
MHVLSSIAYAATGDGARLAYRVLGTERAEVAFVPPWMSTVEMDLDDPYVVPTLRRLVSASKIRRSSIGI